MLRARQHPRDTSAHGKASQRQGRCPRTPGAGRHPAGRHVSVQSNSGRWVDFQYKGAMRGGRLVGAVGVGRDRLVFSIRRAIAWASMV